MNWIKIYTLLFLMIILVFTVTGRVFEEWTYKEALFVPYEDGYRLLSGDTIKTVDVFYPSLEPNKPVISLGDVVINHDKPIYILDRYNYHSLTIKSFSGNVIYFGEPQPICDVWGDIMLSSETEYKDIK